MYIVIGNIIPYVKTMQTSSFKQGRLKNKVPNPRAPRMSTKNYSVQLVNRELYEDWKKESGYEIPWTDFLNVWHTICREIWETVATNQYGIRLPYYLGDLLVRYVKKYRPPIDNGDSIEAQKPIECLNWHSNGKVAKVIWTIHYARRFNKSCRIMSFQPFYLMSRRVSEAVMDNPEAIRDNRVSRANQKIML